MPKDYSKSKIYKIEPICDYEEGDIYIGSTIQNLISHRLAEHVRHYKQWKNVKYHFTSSYSLFEKYGIDNMRIILLETYPCNSNDELRAREAYYQKSMKCVNNRMAFTSKEERSEQQKEYQKQYREENWEELSEKNKKYREENREILLEKKKQYYHENKKETLEKAKEKIICQCGRPIRKYGLKEHQCSDIHKELMLQLTNEK